MATFCQTLSHYTERSLWSTSNWHYHKCVVHNQCDQIGRFFALWATIQSWWPQLFWPNCPFLAIFVRVSKSFIFLVKLFLGNFFRHLTIFLPATLYITHLMSLGLIWLAEFSEASLARGGALLFIIPPPLILWLWTKLMFWKHQNVWVADRPVGNEQYTSAPLVNVIPKHSTITTLQLYYRQLSSQIASPFTCTLSGKVGHGDLY